MSRYDPNETVCGSMMTPDQNVVDEFGDALGIGYDIEKERERDLHRWELDPASAEDYEERLGLLFHAT